MKKVLLATLLTGISAHAVHAESFNGFYLGAQTGYTQRTATFGLSEDYTGPGAVANYINNASSKQKKNGMMYGVMGGYGQNMSGYYLGLEATVHDDNTSTPNQYKAASPSDNQSWSFKGSYKRGLAFGMGPRFGAVFCDSWLAYGKVMVEYSRDKIEHHYVGDTGYAPSQNFIKSQNTFVVVPGLGIEKSYGAISARLEYNYNFGAKMSQAGSYGAGTAASTDRQNVKYNAHTIKIGVSYNF
ncbi:MAG: outer membrane beta-barrel protein [Alphaproteobacteria bacterium]|nr:outer membrane beta-barrel protein [Alphaproteobacteria bacterium]